MSAKTTRVKKSAKERKKVEAKKERYFEAVGRRKTAVARVRIYPSSKKEDGSSSVLVNQKELKDYFPLKKEEDVVTDPFRKLSLQGMRTTVKVKGGGKRAQAEAIRLGIARALVLFDQNLRRPLKTLGYLTRDPRMVERKKGGLRKARRPQQWRKR